MSSTAASAPAASAPAAAPVAKAPKPGSLKRRRTLAQWGSSPPP